MKKKSESHQDNLLTISQLAKLRNVNINSLRYYEKLGILCPVHIDPETRYRYYSLEQLHMLDIILLCIDLNIPLKSLSKFTFQDSVKLKEILYEGQKIAEQRYNDMVIGLKKIEYLLNFLDQGTVDFPHHVTYSRFIPQRLFYTQEYFGDLRDIERVQRTSAKLVKNCPAANRLTFMSGLLLKFTNDGVRQYVFYEMINDGKKMESANILQIPESQFQCYQYSMEKGACDYYTLIKENFGNISEGIVIISNLVRDSMQLEMSYREMQALISS